MSDLRNIIDIYYKITSIIPDEYYGLQYDLEIYIKSLTDYESNNSQNNTPIHESLKFINFSNILTKHIPNIFDLTHDEPRWKFDIRDIFEGNLTWREESALVSEMERTIEDKYDKAFMLKNNYC